MRLSGCTACFGYKKLKLLSNMETPFHVSTAANQHSSSSTSSPAVGNVSLVCSRCSVEKRENSKTAAFICVFLISTAYYNSASFQFFGEQFDSFVAFLKLVLLLRVPVHLETVM